LEREESRKRAEPSARFLRRREIVLLDQPRENALREVARVFRCMAAAADERVERVPVRLTQLAERVVPLLGWTGPQLRRRGSSASFETSPARPAPRRLSCAREDRND
jgi:hypothetical protein